MIIALEESGEAELQVTQEQLAKKLQYDRVKAEDVRLKAMEKLSETKKRGSSADENDDKSKHQRRSGGDAIEYLAERAKVSDQLKEEELKEEDLKMKRDQQTLSREKMEVLSKHQIQMQQQQADMLKLMQQSQQHLLNSQMMMMQQQQQQSKALMVLLKKIINK